MSKKKKIISKEIDEKIEDKEIKDSNNLSKKELYDLRQKEKRAQKEKLIKKNEKNKKKKKSSKKTYKTNLAGRIFAIIMLILMAGSVIATISYYFTSIR